MDLQNVSLQRPSGIGRMKGNSTNLMKQQLLIEAARYLRDKAYWSLLIRKNTHNQTITISHKLRVFGTADQIKPTEGRGTKTRRKTTIATLHCLVAIPRGSN